MLRGVVYRLIEYLASMGHSSIWKLIWAISVSRKFTVGVHLSSTPGIRGPGSATGMDMIQVFKIVQNIDDISMNGLFEFSDTQTRGNSKKLKKPRALKTFRMNSFCVRTINQWNSLPDDIVNSKTVLCFKTKYDRFMGFNKYITHEIY